MEAVLQLGQWVGEVSLDHRFMPVLAAALGSARPGARQSPPSHPSEPICEPVMC